LVSFSWIDDKRRTNFTLQGGVKFKYSDTLYSTVAPVKGCNPQDLGKHLPLQGGKRSDFEAAQISHQPQHHSYILSGQSPVLTMDFLADFIYALKKAFYNKNR